jgi:hypothetical protein
MMDRFSLPIFDQQLLGTLQAYKKGHIIMFGAGKVL